jgi:hypothetical protein
VANAVAVVTAAAVWIAWTETATAVPVVSTERVAAATDVWVAPGPAVIVAATPV